jgi:4-amino-4-deoxy-L-arabinose transferase-like glycosyltransferase
MTRLPGAILASFSIPLIYGMGREIFPARLPAILSALLHLTFLPVIREGRLATENGALLCFGCLLILCGLRSRRDLRWSLGIGLSGSALFLAELQTGLLMMLLLGIFLAWDTPRLWGSLYFWLGSLLGLLPAITWYGWQLSNKGMGISSIVSGQFSPLWWQGTLPLLPFLPGLVFSLSGLYRAWQSRLWGWAKLIIVWVAIAAIALVWGSHTGMPLLLFPAFALAGGVELAEVRGLPGDLAYPRYWRTGLCFFILAIALRGTLWVVIYDPLTAASFWQVAIISTSQLFTLIVTLRLIYRRDPQFIYIFFWGLYVFSLLFFISPYWTSLI